MQGRKIRMLTETVQSFLNRGAAVNLQKLLNKSHVADVALVFRALSTDERIALFSVVHGSDSRATLLEALDPRIQKELIRSIPQDDAARIVECMPHDDAADLLGYLDESLSNELLEKMHGADSLQVEGLLEYEPDTAGGIMATDFVALTEDTSASDAIDVLRTSTDVDMVFYLYVVNDFGHLVGVVSLRNLVTVPPSTKLKKIMESRVIRVRPDTDQEEVASLVARYNFLAIPVVDEGNTLMGIVTVDDIIDVIQEEAQEDMLRMAGAGDDLEATRRVRDRFVARLPWALLTILGGLGSLLILESVTEMLYQHMIYVLFLPLLFTVSAVVGVQSATFVVQILLSGMLPHGSASDLLVREWTVGSGIGILTGLIGGLIAGLLGNWTVAMLLERRPCPQCFLCFDCGFRLSPADASGQAGPAVATGPFTKVMIALTALGIYCSSLSILRVLIGS